MGDGTMWLITVVFGSHWSQNQQIWVRKQRAAAWKSLQHRHSCCLMGYFVPVAFKFIWFHHLQAHTHTHTPESYRIITGLQKHGGKDAAQKTKIYQSFIFQNASVSKCCQMLKFMFLWESIYIPVGCSSVRAGVVLLYRRTSDWNKSSDTTSQRGPVEQGDDLSELEQNYPQHFFSSQQMLE